jgi:CRISPR type I-E-associated protein CasB/Cse2
MTTPTTTAPRIVSLERADAYVDWIIKRCREPGVRSALRRGLRRTPDQAVTMHRYVAAWTESVGCDDEWGHYTVAALIAARPPATRDVTPAEDEPTAATSEASQAESEKPEPRRPNLGATLAKLGGDSDRVDATERRLHLLVRQRVPGIQRHLPGVIRYLASARVTPDWAVLLRDLSRWRRFRDQVAREWLQDYYRARFREEKSAPPTDSVSANDPTGE